MAWAEHVHADFGALAATLAGQLQSACAAGIAARGSAALALAGGRTPLPIYRRLAAGGVAWSQVSVLPTDERCVPHDHPACNLREIAAAFADAHGMQAVGLTPRDGDACRSATYAREAVGRFPQPFDAVVLGMGMDAHTASLFPGPALPAVALDLDSNVDACRIDPLPLPPEAPYARITLTAARLLRTRAIYLVITGAAKREVLREAMASRDARRHPVGAILHAPAALVHIHWSP